MRSILDLNQATKDEQVKLYDRDDILVAIISNAIDLMYARLQIQKNGDPEKWPDELFRYLTKKYKITDNV